MSAPHRSTSLARSAGWIAFVAVAFALTAGVLQWTRADLDPIATHRGLGYSLSEEP